MARKSARVGAFLSTTVTWAVVWGFSGAVLGLIAIIVRPDTGHIPRYEVPFLIGIPTGVVGIIGGAVFALVGDQRGSAKTRGIIGATVGGAMGIALMLLTHTSFHNAAFWVVLGAALGFGLAVRGRRRSQPEAAE